MAELDIASETYEVYADVEFADIFLAADVRRAASWAALADDEDAKGRGLVSGTRALQRLVGWTDGVPSITTPPLAVQQATAMLAADMLSDPDLGDTPGTASNIKRVRGGPAEVEFFRALEGRPLPAGVWDLLASAGLLGSAADPGAGGAYVGGIRSRSHFDDDCGVVPWRDTGDWGGSGCGQ
jgi:hypothetical protein